MYPNKNNQRNNPYNPQYISHPNQRMPKPFNIPPPPFNQPATAYTIPPPPQQFIKSPPYYLNPKYNYYTPNLNPPQPYGKNNKQNNKKLLYENNYNNIPYENINKNIPYENSNNKNIPYENIYKTIPYKNNNKKIPDENYNNKNIPYQNNNNQHVQNIYEPNIYPYEKNKYSPNTNSYNPDPLTNDFKPYTYLQMNFNSYKIHAYNINLKDIDRNGLKLFEKYDKNMNGYLKINELYGCLNEFMFICGEGKVDYNDVWYLLYLFDFDGNGVIEYEEFRMMLKELAGIKGYNRDYVKIKKLKKHKKKY